MPAWGQGSEGSGIRASGDAHPSGHPSPGPSVTSQAASSEKLVRGLKVKLQDIYINSACFLTPTGSNNNKNNEQMILKALDLQAPVFPLPQALPGTPGAGALGRLCLLRLQAWERQAAFPFFPRPACPSQRSLFRKAFPISHSLCLPFLRRQLFSGPGPMSDSKP